MSTLLITPNMGLTEPAVGSTASPFWAMILNADMGIIDQHDHTPGRGVPITPSGLNINSDLSLQGNNLINVNSLVYNGTVTGTPSFLSTYTNGTDLFYTDINGASIQLTKAGGPNAGTGNIQNLPSTPTGGAGISWVNSQSTFQMLLDAGTVGASVDMGTAILRYPGSYPTPSGTNAIQLQVPSSISSSYSLTLPPIPGSISFLTIDTSGTISEATNMPATQLAAQSITGSQLVNQTVTSTQLANGTVGTTQIADHAVTPVKLQAVVDSSTDFSATTSTGGPTPLVGVSMTVSGIRPISINLGPRVAGTPGQFNVTSTSGLIRTGYVRFDVGVRSYVFEFSETPNSGESWPLNISFVAQALANTSLVINVYIGVSAGTATMSVTDGTLYVVEL